MAIEKGLNQTALVPLTYYGKAATVTELKNEADTDLDGKYFLVADQPFQLHYRKKQGYVSGVFAPGLMIDTAGLFLVDGYALVQESTGMQLVRTLVRTGNNYVYRETFNCYIDTATPPVLHKVIAILGAHYTEISYDNTAKVTTTKKYVVTSEALDNPTTQLYYQSTMNHVTGVFEETVNPSSVLFLDTFTGANGDTLV